MQITLNIDSANIGGTVEQVFASLSDEEKKGLAKQVMLEVLRKPMASERLVYEQKMAEQVIAQKAGSHYDRIDTIEKAKSTYEYRTLMEKYKSTSERMMEEITRTAVKHYSELVSDLVKEDEQVQTIFSVMREQFVADMPKLMQMAMAAQFAKQVDTIKYAFEAASGASAQVQMLGEGLRQRLAANGINI